MVDFDGSTEPPLLGFDGTGPSAIQTKTKSHFCFLLSTFCFLLPNAFPADAQLVTRYRELMASHGRKTDFFDVGDRLSLTPRFSACHCPHLPRAHLSRSNICNGLKSRQVPWAGKAP
jgi:hypothetical protein